MKLALSDILGVNVCSYRGPLDRGESIDEYMMYDIRERQDENGMIKDDKGNMIKIDDLQPEWTYFEDYKENLAKDLASNFRDNLGETLKKYGILLKGFSLYKPTYYNFEHDTLDIEFDITEGNRQLENPELIEGVKYYIDNIREKSRDGYQSFEPSKLEEVDRTDYCYLWAVLNKENLLDEMKADIEDSLLDINEWDYIDNTRYELYKDGEWIKYKFDYDNACLITL